MANSSYAPNDLDPTRPHNTRNLARSVDEGKLIGVLNSYFDEARAAEDSGISGQRTRAQLRYFGKIRSYEKLATTGRSTHVSRDLFDSIETTKAYLLEAFSASRNVVRFTPNSPELTQLADMGTRFINDRFYKPLSKGGLAGYQVLRSLIHDGLLSKVGIAYVDFDESLEEKEINVQGVPAQAFPAMLSELGSLLGEDPIESADAQIEEVPGPDGMPVYNVEATVRQPRNKVEFRSVAPEKFKCDPQAESLDDAIYMVEEMEITVSDLLDMNFDPDIVRDTTANYDDPSQSSSDWSRYADSDSWSSNYTSVRTEDQDRRILRHWVVRLDLQAVFSPNRYDLDQKPGSLYEIYECSGRIMAEPRKITRIPFFVWSPYSISHRWHGMSLDDVLGDVQDTRSTTIRSVVDNQNINNTSRTVAIKSLLANPRAVTDNRIGGTIFVKQMGAIEPLQPIPLAAETFLLNEELKQEGESRTGVSRVSKGLDPNAISKQNAESLIDSYADRGERRTLMMARDFAYDVVEPVMSRILDLHIETSQDGMITLDDGQQIPTDALQQLGGLDVRVALTPDEGELQAKKLISLDAAFRADPDTASMYGPQQRFQLWSDVIDYLDIPSGTEYLMSPASEQFQQQSQQAQQQQQEAMMMEKAAAAAQIELTQAQVQAIQEQAYFRAREIAHKMAQDELAMHLKVDTEEHDALDDDRNFALDVRKETHQEWLDKQELALEKTQKRSVAIN